MPSVSDVITIKLQLDSEGMLSGTESTQRAVDKAKRDLQQQGTQLELIAKSVGASMETLIKGVAGFFGVVLSFEGFKNLVIEMAAAGTQMGLFAKSIGLTVEQTQKYQQAFNALTGGDTGIQAAFRTMAQDIARVKQGFAQTEWMVKFQQLTGKTAVSLTPEQVTQEITKEFERRKIGSGAPGTEPAIAARSWLGNLPFTDADLVALTNRQKLLKELEAQTTIGTPTTAQTDVLTSLEADIQHVKAANNLLLIQAATMAAPFIHELATMAINAFKWLRGIATSIGYVPAGAADFAVGGPAGWLIGDYYRRQGQTSVRTPEEIVSGNVAQPSSQSLLRTSPTPLAAPSSGRPSRGSAVGLYHSGASGDAVDDALKLEGLNERRDRDTIKEYLRTGGAGMDPATTAWCAAFVNASLQREGIKGTGSNVATSFLRWGSPVNKKDVQKGDVLVQSRGLGPDQTGGHVGMATGKTRTGPSGLEIEMVAGNTKDSVRRYWVSGNSVQVRRESGNISGTPGALTGATFDSSSVLKDRRTRFAAELKADPQLRLRLAAVATLENEGDPTAVVESLMNRSDYTKRTLRRGLTDGFYGPVNKGWDIARMEELRKDPARLARINAKIDAALEGSNLIKGATDQGSGTDQNVNWPGGRIIRHGETYTDFGGGPGGHAGAARYREQLMHEVDDKMPVTGAAAAAADAEASRAKVIHNQTDSHINEVIVNTHAVDPAGIASDIKDEVGKQLAPTPGGDE